MKERRDEGRWRRGEFKRVGIGVRKSMSIGIIDSFVNETFAARFQPNSRIHFKMWFSKERNCKT